MKIFYSVEDVSPEEMLPILARGYPRKVQQEFYGPEYADGLNFAAKEAANDWHYNHDGWEHSSWPVEFRLYDESGKVLGTFSVDRDIEPVFSARMIKKGLLPYEKVAEEIEQLLVEVEEASKVSVLRNEPDYEWIYDLVEEVYAEIVYDKYRTNSYGF